MPDYDLIAILGPTASGKTPFAAALAYELNTEIISADSRQIYRGMDLGTGKDLADYTVNGRTIPYHLIDIAFLEFLRKHQTKRLSSRFMWRDRYVSGIRVERI